jgi:membrane protease YdiL (CAAX protease family)
MSGRNGMEMGLPGLRRGAVGLLVAGGILGLAPIVALAAAWTFAAAAGAVSAGVFGPGAIERNESLKTVIYFAALHGTVAILSFAAMRWTSRDGTRAPEGELWPEGPHLYARSSAALLAGMGLWLSALALIAPQALWAEVGDYPRLIRSEGGLLLVPVLCLLAPVAEELLFRGLLFDALRGTQLGAMGAATLTSLAWALLHVDHSWFSRAHLFLAGLVLSWLVVRTGRLGLAIWCHVLFNLTLSAVLLLTVPAG